MERMIVLEKINLKVSFVPDALGISQDEWRKEINWLLQREERIIVSPEKYGFTCKELEEATRGTLANEGPRPAWCSDVIVALWKGKKGREEITMREAVVTCVLTVNMITHLFRPGGMAFDRVFFSFN